jgi:hypothetical protein
MIEEGTDRTAVAFSRPQFVPISLGPSEGLGSSQPAGSSETSTVLIGMPSGIRISIAMSPRGSPELLARTSRAHKATSRWCRLPQFLCGSNARHGALHPFRRSHNNGCFRSARRQLPTKRRAPFGRAHPPRARFLRGSQGGRSVLRSQGRERVCPAHASPHRDSQSLLSLCLLRNPEPRVERVSVSLATSSSAHINCSGFEGRDPLEGGYFACPGHGISVEAG